MTCRERLRVALSSTPRPKMLRKQASMECVIFERRVLICETSGRVLDQEPPIRGRSQDRAAPMRRCRTSPFHLCKVRGETSSSPSPAWDAHSQADSTPSRRT